MILHHPTIHDRRTRRRLSHHPPGHPLQLYHTELRPLPKQRLRPNSAPPHVPCAAVIRFFERGGPEGEGERVVQAAAVVVELPGRVHAWFVVDVGVGDVAAANFCWRLVSCLRTGEGALMVEREKGAYKYSIAGWERGVLSSTGGIRLSRSD